MGKKFLVDTNILIGFQTKIIPQKGFEYVAKTIDEDFTISFISYIEYLGYKDATEAMHSFVSLAKIIETDRDIINQTILLRKSRNIKVPDALIAATAIVHKMGLITNNEKDFLNIKGLKVINPYKL